MSATAYQQRRDQRIADDYSVDQALMCAAAGCPNRWSVSLGNGRGTCSAHTWAQAEHWPGITQREVDRETERAYQAAVERPPARSAPGKCPDRLRGRLRAAVQTLGEQRPGRDWAERLRAREQAGGDLTEFQRHAWRAVLRDQASQEAEA